MIEPLKWVKIEISSHITPNMTSVHVDAENFMWMYCIEPLVKFDGDFDTYFDKNNMVVDLINGKTIEDDYLIEEKRIFPFIYTLREMKSINNVIPPSVNSCKPIRWLRFYKYGDKYLATNDGVPIKWKELTNANFVGKQEK